MCIYIYTHVSLPQKKRNYVCIYIYTYISPFPCPTKEEKLKDIDIHICFPSQRGAKLYLYIYLYIYIYIYIHIFALFRVFGGKVTCIYIYIYTYLFSSFRSSACVWLYIYIYLCVHMYIYCIYIYTHFVFFLQMFYKYIGPHSRDKCICRILAVFIFSGKTAKMRQLHKTICLFDV